MKKLRVGVIGVGGMGVCHVRGHKHHDQVKVVAIADVSKARLKRVGEQEGIARRYGSGEAMLAKEKLDVVSVATPNKCHKRLTVAALKAGCHVLCEKPMALNAKEGAAMAAAAKKAKRRLMINFSYRFTDQSWALKQEVDTGILGHVYFARTVWHRRRGFPRFGSHFCRKELSGGGPLIDLGVHRLDLALWLMGYPKPVWVLGSTYDPIARARAEREGLPYDVEDLAVGLVKFENGATLEIEASWAAHIAERELMETRLYGTKAGLVQRNRNGCYEFQAEIYLERNGRQFDMKLHPPVPGVKPSMYYFDECILTDVPHTATGDEAVVVMELLDAIYESAATGEPVRVNA